MKKRIVPILLCIALLLSLLPSVPTHAAEHSELRTVKDLSPLEEVLYEGMMECAEKIDISALSPSKNEVDAAMQYLSYAAPELFHVNPSYTTGLLGQAVASVTPTYKMTGEALTLARAKYLLAIDEIVSGVDSTWSEAEICLYLHDYLCANFAYDTSYEIYDAYRFLTEGTGVCQAYTLTYAALLARFDIPTTFATGMDGDVGHIWSIVTIGGKNYHVDVTWGDPLISGNDAFGTAHHTSFLKSDAAIDAAGHKERQNYGGIVCNDTLYDHAAFTSFTSPFAFVDGVAYGIKDGKVYAFIDDLSGSTLIYTVTDEWRTGMQYLTEKPAGIAGYGRTLYLNTPHSILALDPLTKGTETVHTINDALILTMYGVGSTLVYQTAKDIHGNGAAIATVTLPPAIPPCPGAHDMEEYAVIPSTCAEAGARYSRCTVCGHKESEALPLLPHDTEATVVPPAYGVAGYTVYTCRDCGNTTTGDAVPPLPLPTAAEYADAVRRAEEATKPEPFILAVREARAMEPHIAPEDILAERETLNALIADYDARATEVNVGVRESVSSLLFDFGALPSHATLTVLLWLLLRRLLMIVR